MKRVARGLSAAIGTFVLLAGVLAPAGVLAASGDNNGAVVSAAVRHDVSPPLRAIHVSAPSAANLTERPLRRVNPGNGSGPDTAVQAPATAAFSSNTTSGQAFEGIGKGQYGFTVQYAPPDTNGAAGATQYVQWVNTYLAVFDKSTHALQLLEPGNAVWSGFGGGCETNNDGDPVVQYDKIANRWILTQFSVSTTPYLQCVAVSATDDATGAYYRYAFSYGNSSFPDYPKLGVWPDGYYMSYNIFGRFFFKGAMVCALDRAAMLANANATQQCFQLSRSYGGLLPSDLDGSSASLQPGGSGLPPAGAPNLFLNFGSNSLNVWKFHVDWSNSANTTLSGPTSIPVDAFTTACNGGGTCIPQPGTSQKLDSLGDRLMYRLAYRNFGDHQALVVNQSVSVSGTTSVRWYELRMAPGSSTPTLFQDGTLDASDGISRWMGSIAMDASGDIALGYSASSSSVYPSVRLTGRVPGDASGTMEAETILKAGTGSQTQNLSRWGDYSAMSVDPVDDCTFWYTNEYLKSDGTWNWNTWIASFKFDSCSSGGSTPTTGTLTGTVKDASTSAGIPGATVTTSTGGYRATTDINGQYSMTVTGGTYDVTASASSYNSSTVNGVTVTNGQTTTQDFYLTATAPTTGSISGKVTDETTGFPIGGATVSISGGASTTTDSTGSYQFTNLTPTTYSLTATATGYVDSAAQNVAVTAGVDSQANFVLTPSGGSTATVPGQPAAPTASAGPGKGISVSWSAPTDTGGSAITSYVVYRYVGPACTTQDASFTSSNTKLKDSTTTKGSSYCYTVAAVNSVGEGLESAASSPVTALK